MVEEANQPEVQDTAIVGVLKQTDKASGELRESNI